MSQPNRPSVDDFLRTGTGARGAKWGQTEPQGPKAPGAVEGGVILEMETVEQWVYNPDPKAPKVQAVWENSGELRWQLKIVMQTNKNDDDDDDGKRQVFVSGPLKKTIEAYMRENKIKRLEIGGELLIKFVKVDYQATGKPNVWAVKYTPPVAKAGEDFFDEPSERPSQPAHHGVSEEIPSWASAASSDKTQTGGTAIERMKASSPGLPYGQALVAASNAVQSEEEQYGF